MILEETDNGKFSDITADNLRIDIAVEIIKDFFSQCKM
jgi:hypothetical protein